MSEGDRSMTHEDHSDSDDSKKYPLLLDGTKYFQVKEDREGVILAECLTCTQNGNESKKNIYRGSTQTKSNFLTHLRRRHPEVLKEFEKENPAKKRKIAYHKFELMNLNERQDNTNRNILDFLITNFLPPQVINSNFQNIIHDLNRHIELSDPDQIKVEMNIKLIEVKQSLRKSLENVSSLSLAVNLLQINKLTHLVISAFWLDPANLTRQDALLSCKHSQSTNFTIEPLDKVVLKVMNEYSISKQQVTSIILNDLAQYNADFDMFINDPANMSPVSQKYYAISNTENVDHQIIELEQFEKRDVKVENSLVYQLMKFAFVDFYQLLVDHSKLDIHYKVFSMTNVLWNLAIEEPDLFPFNFNVQVKSPSANIKSFYNAVIDVLTIQSKKKELIENIQKIQIIFNAEEYNYLQEISEFLHLMMQGINIIESDENGLYCNAAPIITTLDDRLEKLQFVELLGVLHQLKQNFKKKFASFLDISDQNGAMYASCFHPGYKRDWIITNRDRMKVKELCKTKILERAPHVAMRKQAASKPKVSSFVIMRSHMNMDEKDHGEMEILSYFNEVVDMQDKLERFPTIKRLMLEYNSTICSSTIVKSVIDRSNLLRNLATIAVDPDLINCYAILNAAKKQLESDEEENQSQ